VRQNEVKSGREQKYLFLPVSFIKIWNNWICNISYKLPHCTWNSKPWVRDKNHGTKIFIFL